MYRGISKKKYSYTLKKRKLSACNIVYKLDWKEFMEK